LRQKTHGIFKEEAIMSTSVLFYQVSTSESKKKLINTGRSL